MFRPCWERSSAWRDSIVDWTLCYIWAYLSCCFWTVACYNIMLLYITERERRFFMSRDLRECEVWSSWFLFSFYMRFWSNILALLIFGWAKWCESREFERLQSESLSLFKRFLYKLLRSVFLWNWDNDRAAALLDILSRYSLCLFYYRSSIFLYISPILAIFSARLFSFARL